MRITFTLTGGSSSTDAGPFNISGTTSGNVTYWIATGVTKTQLTNGHPVDTIYETITGGTVASTGTCTTTDTWSVTPSPTPTSTPPPPTPTSVPSYLYQLGPGTYSQATISTACTNITGEPADFTIDVFASTNVAANVTQFYTDTDLTIEYQGVNNFHAYYLGSSGGRSGLPYTGRVSGTGLVSDRTACAE
jgi:hypothetical protein